MARCYICGKRAESGLVVHKDCVGGWISVKDRLPEDDSRVLVYWHEEPDLHQSEVLEYHRKGDIVEDEVIYQGDTAGELLLDVLFGRRGEKEITEDGFYIYDCVDDTGLNSWRRHKDCITHWMPIIPPEVKND